MTFSTSQALMTSETPEEYFDRRRHISAWTCSLPGPFPDPGIGNDESLSTINLSCSGALVQSSTLPDPGAELVCYFDDLGRVVATVVRHTGEGFALSFNVASHKREKIADRLTLAAQQGHAEPVSEEREAPRHAADVPAQVILRQAGTEL
jgi:hypothetical protein